MSFAMSFKQQLAHYLDLDDIAAVLRAERPTVLIAHNPQQQSSSKRYSVAPATSHFLRQLMRMPATTRWASHLHTHTRCMQWARYGYIDGSMSAEQLDEPGRVSGTQLNEAYATDALVMCRRARQQAMDVLCTIQRIVSAVARC
jgi:hypothetical protein